MTNVKGYQFIYVFHKTYFLMAKIVKIKKGLDIPLTGQPSNDVVEVLPSHIAICPDDFPGYKWRPVVKPGDKVVVGSPLCEAKEADDIKLVAYSCGTIKEVRRGHRRRLEAIVIETIAEEHHYDFDIASWSKNTDDIRAVLKHSGIWAMMRQRPFDIVPAAEAIPSRIFITAFDSAPHAPEIIDGLDRQDIAKGLEILNRICDCKPFIGCRVEDAEMLEVTANQMADVVIFKGPHPSGNVGTHISKIAPVSKGETVWTMDIRTLAAIGYLFNTGNIPTTTRIAVTGPALANPMYVATTIGASVSEIMANFKVCVDGNIRVISGNVLTGIAVQPEKDFLRFPYRQICVIPDGKEKAELLGWASLSLKKYSVKRTFLSAFMPKSHSFSFDTRILGGRRAFILTDEMQEVFPLDIYPEYLLKAILSENPDKMEQLGIYEVAPEDFALCEFVDTSKQELQAIVRLGLDRLRDEL